MMLIAISGFSAFVSRINFQMFNQAAKLDSISMFLCTVLVNLLLAGLHPRLFENFAGQIGYVIMLGLHTGFWSTFLGYVVEEFIGVEYISSSKGFVILSVGLGCLLGPPLAGWVIDKQGDYDIAFYFAGSCLLASSVLMMGVFLKKCHYRPYDWSDSDSERSAASGNRVKIGGDEEEKEQLVV